MEVTCWQLVLHMMTREDDRMTVLDGFDVDDIEDVVWWMRGFATAALTQAHGDRAAAQQKVLQYTAAGYDQYVRRYAADGYDHATALVAVAGTLAAVTANVLARLHHGGDRDAAAAKVTSFIEMADTAEGRQQRLMDRREVAQLAKLTDAEADAAIEAAVLEMWFTYNDADRET
jgi:hypothetical protein